MITDARIAAIAAEAAKDVTGRSTADPGTGGLEIAIFNAIAATLAEERAWPMPLDPKALMAATAAVAALDCVGRAVTDEGRARMAIEAYLAALPSDDACTRGWREGRDAAVSVVKTYSDMADESADRAIGRASDPVNDPVAAAFSLAYELLDRALRSIRDLPVPGGEHG